MAWTVALDEGWWHSNKPPPPPHASLVSTTEDAFGTPYGLTVPSTSQERWEPAHMGRLPTHLPDISDEVRAQVSQRLRGATAPFLLMDEDSATGEEVSPTKRRRRNIKSGKLRTRDTHVVHRVKLPHENGVFFPGTCSRIPGYDFGAL